MKTYTTRKASLSRLLRDASDKPDAVAKIQNDYLDLLMASFQRLLNKAYSKEPFTEDEKAKLHRYVDRIIEAKLAAAGNDEPKDGFYKRPA